MKNIIFVIFILLSINGRCNDSIPVIVACDYQIEFMLLSNDYIPCDIIQYHEGEYKEAKFQNIRVLNLLDYYTGDTIPSEIILKIEYLLLPVDTLLEPDNIYRAAVFRGYNYNYLEFITTTNGMDIVGNPYVRTVGLPSCGGASCFWISRLYYRRIIPHWIYQLFYRKCKKQTDIESCLEVNKKFHLPDTIKMAE